MTEPENNRAANDTKLAVSEVVLNTAKKAWKPTKLTGNDSKDLDKNRQEDILRKKTRAILNKLTPKKLEILIKQFDELVINTWDKLEICIKLVFEKALDEPAFSAVYAEMCNQLKSKCPQSSDGQKKSFKSILITTCQNEFVKDYMQDLDKSNYDAAVATAESEDRRKEIKKEWAETETYARKRRLGNIRFIGEIYKHKMLTVRIIHECINKLLNIKELDTLEARDESLECLCKLLTTVGKHFEEETSTFFQTAAKQNKTHNMADVNQPDIYFQQMKRLADENKGLSSRVRFMLLDVIDLRRCNWEPKTVGDSNIERIEDASTSRPNSPSSCISGSDTDFDDEYGLFCATNIRFSGNSNSYDSD